MIYHAAIPADWEAAVGAGAYRTSTRGRSLDEAGFIHAAYDWQLDGVANRFYADVDELLVLVIDVDRLDVPVIDESSSGDQANERFPHVYGPIPVEAVIEVQRWCRRRGREWELASLLESRPER